MADTVVNTDTKDKILLEGENETVLVTAKGGIARYYLNSEFFAIYDTARAVGSEITVNGYVIGIDGTENFGGVGIASEGAGTHITIGQSGYVSGDTGIATYGSDLELRNDGQVQASGGYGILSQSENGMIRNGGIIAGYNGIILYGGNASIFNQADGRIIGYSAAAVTISPLDGTEASLVNHGTISGGIDSEGGNITIINDGTIVGSIVLGSGDDLIDTRGGKITDVIATSFGNDTFITDKSSYTLIESADGGFDTVKSSVSYTLSANVESLTLIGKKNINGTGTDDAGMDNYLNGNGARNTLNGLSGYNELFGKGGQDLLIGGIDYDLFGIGKGYGRDTVKGYQDGLDQIDIYFINGVDDFRSLQSHIEQHKGDTWIDFGKDVLILKGIDHTILDENDFLFDY